ncbi:MAG: 50S ribosomal protein L24 [Candidatus Rehaiarchaeum fermentans]|nr:50S ribosomal protein L24 [Candidatus Rehaiarchaeum fermentans]
MKKKWSSSWKSSKSPRKQRNYIRYAPLHVKRKLIVGHLSKELREKYKTRSIVIRKGDKVKVMRGKYKGTEGKVEKIFTKSLRVGLDSLKITNKRGQKVYIKLRPSALLVTELDLSDKYRLEKLNRLIELKSKAKQSTS